MKTTEEKLIYLKETKAFLRELINNYGGSITDKTPFSQYPAIARSLLQTKNIALSTAELVAVAEVSAKTKRPRRKKRSE